MMLREVHLEADEMLTGIFENCTRYRTAVTIVNFEGAIHLLRRLGFRLVILVLAIANITGAVSSRNPEIRRTGCQVVRYDIDEPAHALTIEIDHELLSGSADRNCAVPINITLLISE
jgi:hypothetical protein